MRSAILSPKAVGRAMMSLLVASCAATLTGCLDYEEEMWLNSDLSGHATMTVALSDTLSDPRLHGKDLLGMDQIRRDVESVEGLKIEDFQTFKENGKQVMRMSITFTSWEKLGWIGRDTTKGGSFAGNLKVSRERGHVVLERSLASMVDTKPKSDGEALLTSGLTSLFLGNNAFSYTLHLPAEPENANSLQVDKANRTVRWRFPLSQLMREPATMRVEIKQSSYAIWWMTGSIVVAGLMGALVLLRRSLNSKQQY